MPETLLNIDGLAVSAMNSMKPVLEMTGPEFRARVFTVKFFEKTVECILEMRKADIFADDQPFDLVEDGRMRSVDIVAAVYPARYRLPLSPPLRDPRCLLPIPLSLLLRE